MSRVQDRDVGEEGLYLCCGRAGPCERGGLTRRHARSGGALNPARATATSRLLLVLYYKLGIIKLSCRSFLIER